MGSSTPLMPSRSVIASWISWSCDGVADCPRPLVDCTSSGAAQGFSVAGSQCAISVAVQGISAYMLKCKAIIDICANVNP